MKQWLFVIVFTALFASANTMAQVPENAVWIDVRSAGEFADGHLPEAVNIPFDAIEKGVRGMDLAADAPIYLYCAAGGRAEKARQSLLTAGYDNVINVGSLADAQKLTSDAQ